LPARPHLHAFRRTCAAGFVYRLPLLGSSAEAVIEVVRFTSRRLVAAADEVRRLSGVAGQPDGPVVGRPRLLAAAQPAQQVGAGAVDGVVALQRQTVHLRQRDLRAVELGDRDRPVEPHAITLPVCAISLDSTSQRRWTRLGDLVARPSGGRLVDFSICCRYNTAVVGTGG
jgi:hypothetical protein